MCAINKSYNFITIFETAVKIFRNGQLLAVGMLGTQGTHGGYVGYPGYPRWVQGTHDGYRVPTVSKNN